MLLAPAVAFLVLGPLDQVAGDGAGCCSVGKMYQHPCLLPYTLQKSGGSCPVGTLP